MLIFSHRSRRSFKKGFTLIELLTVVSIMVIVTAVILFKQSAFDSSTLLRSLAYSVALSVRQAQVYGSSVLGTATSTCVGGNTLGSTCFANAYGVHFSSGSPTSYLIFADLNNNGAYDTGEAIKTFTFNNGYSIKDLCATAINGGAVTCVAGGLTFLDISFRRPNPEACFATNFQSSACMPTNAQFYSQGKVTLVNQANSTSTRSVTVTQTGEIQVCALAGC